MFLFWFSLSRAAESFPAQPARQVCRTSRPAIKTDFANFLLFNAFSSRRFASLRYSLLRRRLLKSTNWFSTLFFVSTWTYSGSRTKAPLFDELALKWCCKFISLTSFCIIFSRVAGDAIPVCDLAAQNPRNAPQNNFSLSGMPLKFFVTRISVDFKSLFVFMSFAFQVSVEARFIRAPLIIIFSANKRLAGPLQLFCRLLATCYQAYTHCNYRITILNSTSSSKCWAYRSEDASAFHLCFFASLYRRLQEEKITRKDKIISRR